MASKKKEMETPLCPVGRFFLELERVSGRKSDFLGHLNRSRAEFLKALRVLLDEKIEDLEGRDAGRAQKRATRIKVE